MMTPMSPGSSPDPVDRGRGHRLFAAVYDRLGRRAEAGWMGDRRRELLAAARGRVLEVGAGTGANLPHYRDIEELTLTEPDPAMRRRVAPKLAGLAFPVTVLDAPAEALPAPDASVDTVVVTIALCSVDDPARALAEARRVLVPGGRLLFIEHVRGEGRRGRWQERVTPLWRRLFGGCHPNRDTVASIRAAGFEIEEITTRDDGPAPVLVRPVVIGAARAPAH
jgi:ubiquinone/menaquinone biosynthesis C-methylase UbiE